MSRLEEFAEQLKSQAQSLWEKIQESQAYTQLSDRYQSLSPSGQKSVQVITGLVIAGIIFFVPLSQVQDSHNFLADFEAKRTLIRDLFKTYRDASGGPQYSPAPAASELMGTIQNALQSAKLVPEQIVGVAPSKAEGRLIPDSLLQEVVEVKLSKLNLRQVVDIGAQLTNISNVVKVKDMMMKANAELAGYFDVTYRLYSLKVPDPLPEPPPEPVDTKKKKKADAAAPKEDE